MAALQKFTIFYINIHKDLHPYHFEQTMIKKGHSSLMQTKYPPDLEKSLIAKILCHKQPLSPLGILPGPIFYSND